MSSKISSNSETKSTKTIVRITAFFTNLLSVNHAYFVCLETLFNKLTEYEQTGIDFYSGQDKKKCVLTHPNHDEYESVMEELPDRLSNPYK